MTDTPEEDQTVTLYVPSREAVIEAYRRLCWIEEVVRPEVTRLEGQAMEERLQGGTTDDLDYRTEEYTSAGHLLDLLRDKVLGNVEDVKRLLEEEPPRPKRKLPPAVAPWGKWRRSPNRIYND